MILQYFNICILYSAYTVKHNQEPGSIFIVKAYNSL